MSSTLGGKLGLTNSSTWDNVVTAITNATVSTVLSFSLASTAYNSITFSWKNPASGGFAGVVIVGKTGSYPSSPTDGTTYYIGLGNNSSASGTSSTTLTSFSGSTTYYFRCWSYVLINNVKWYSDTYKQATITTAAQKGQKIFTASGTFTVPTGVNSIDIFCVGGGGGGVSDTVVGSGGGGGYTATKLKQDVTPGTSYTVTIGAGGYAETSQYGGSTSFDSILTAFGGYTAGHDEDGYTSSARGGCGGSGGNSGSRTSGYAASGGSDGSDEIRKSGNTIYGKGQGTTTKAFAESSNTLYAGGGGAYYYSDYAVGTPGGDGGGGGGYGYDVYVSYAHAGTANTGGGGGGGSTKSSDKGPSGSGGSGICIVRWGY